MAEHPFPSLPFESEEPRPDDTSAPPAEVAVPEPVSPSEPAQPHVWTVSELLAETRAGLESTFPSVWVRGELSNFRRQSSGHWYFNLKDDNAVLNVAMFRRDNRGVPFAPEDGLEVTAIGRLTLYERTGRFQLIANSLEPVGWGAQQLAFEQLKRRLEAEGMFAPARKRALPGLPSCVGVVTSPTGAAWHDMTRVWKRRAVSVRVVLSPTRVQGPEAPAEIARAIEQLDRLGQVDVIIVGRGGGSREDLWAFNEEVVARAIANCSVPVISGVGHEIDTTISDLTADRRAATPTAAAEIVAAAREELLARIGALQRRAHNAVTRQTQGANHRLHNATLHRALARPSQSLLAHHQRLDLAWERLEGAVDSSMQRRTRRLGTMATTLAKTTPRNLAGARREALHSAGARLQAAMLQRLHRGRERLGMLAARTEALSPLAVLGRGYALCRDQDGKVLRAAAEVAIGDGVSVRLAAGVLQCDVRERSADS